jgi:MFS transporter, DHA1 family, multidrug resistance protein
LSQLAIIIYCGVLMSISSFAIDITLPAFPEMVGRLDAPYSTIQWTVTAYMFAAGLAQLVWGPASDRFGRRPVMAAGLSVFLAGSVVTVFAPSIEWLLAGRAVQGLGAAAAIVLARAILRDLYSGQELARNLALAWAIFAVGPILAPLVGALVLVPFGWRAVYVMLGLIGIGLILPLIWLRETIAHRSQDALRPDVLMQRLKRLFVHPQSRYFLLLSGLVMSIMVFNLSALPRVYDISFGVTGVGFAVLFALHGTGIIVGQLINRRLIPVLGTVPAMLVANAVMILSAALMLGFTMAGVISAYLMSAMLVLFATGYLVVFSNASAMVLDPHGDIAGFAAAFFGVFSQIGAAVIVSVLVLVAGGSALAYTAVLLCVCVASFMAVGWWQVRHAGRTASQSI